MGQDQESLMSVSLIFPSSEDTKSKVVRELVRQLAYKIYCTRNQDPALRVVNQIYTKMLNSLLYYLRDCIVSFVKGVKNLVYLYKNEFNIYVIL